MEDVDGTIGSIGLMEVSKSDIAAFHEAFRGFDNDNDKAKIIDDLDFLQVPRAVPSEQVSAFGET